MSLYRLRFTAFILVVMLGLLAGCPQLPPVSNCTPSSTRCAGTGASATPEVCSQTQRWTPVELNASPCATTPGAVCCPAQGRRGRVVHACVPQSACVPESAEGGALSTPPVLSTQQKPDAPVWRVMVVDFVTNLFA